MCVWKSITWQDFYFLLFKFVAVFLEINQILDWQIIQPVWYTLKQLFILSSVRGKWWIFTLPLHSLVNIHHYSPPLWWIIVSCWRLNWWPEMRQELMTCSSILFNPVQPNWKLFWGWWDNWKVKKSSKTLRLLYNFRGLLPWKLLSQQSNILDLKKVTGLDTSHQWICHSKIWYSPNIFQSLTHLSLYEHTQYSMFRKIYPTKDIICSKKKEGNSFPRVKLKKQMMSKDTSWQLETTV